MRYVCKKHLNIKILPGGILQGEVRNKLTGKILKPALDRGYLRVCLCSYGKRKMFRIHCLVAEVFIGPRPAAHVVAHLDGNPGNNNIGNLAYTTHTENMAHKNEHGTQLIGEKNPQTKLSKAQVKKIRSSKETQRVLAKKYSVGQSTISRIKTGELWTHL